MTGFTYQYSDWPQSLKDEYKYDPAAAKNCWRMPVTPSGFKTNLVISNDSDLSLFQIVKAYFADVGVDMTLTPMDPPAWQAYVLSSTRMTRWLYETRVRLASTLNHRADLPVFNRLPDQLHDWLATPIMTPSWRAHSPPPASML